MVTFWCAVFVAATSSLDDIRKIGPFCTVKTVSL